MGRITRVPSTSTNSYYRLAEPACNVTLSWTITPGGPPQTFHELVLEHLRVGAQPAPTALLPATATSLSAAVPAGAYYQLLLGGNGCGKSDVEAIQFTVP